MKVNNNLSFQTLEPQLKAFWQVAANKVRLLEEKYDESNGSPVFTVDGQYSSRGWTEWTQGFQYGIQLLVGEASNDEKLLALGKANTIQKMPHHLTHFGVHDHGFNNLSTYGNLLRQGNTNILEMTQSEKQLYELSLKISGSVQAKRWTDTDKGGYIYSFNGPHSLFIDTIRTCRILLAADRLNHTMLDEGDRKINLLIRALVHGATTAEFAVYYGENRDAYDVRGRVAHESIFNLNDGSYRCPSSQQGYSGFTTWTRGLAWAILGYAEFLEFLIDVKGLKKFDNYITRFERVALATADFYIEHTSKDGIPYWDTGAPNLHKLGDYTKVNADPYNDFEPVDASAAAIAAQGLIRIGNYFKNKNTEGTDHNHYTQAGISILDTLLKEPFLSTADDHQGILLHSIYHRPNGWDYIPKGSRIPHNESSMWGDYHIVELCLLAQRIIEGKYYTFYDGLI